MRTDEGITGLGSGDLMLGFHGHEGLFIGRDPLAIERHYRVLSHINFHYGECWPLDLALWDLAGTLTGQPCWKLLGGLADRVRAYASSGTLRDPGRMAAAAEAYLDQGFRAMKIRFQRGDRRDDMMAEPLRVDAEGWIRLTDAPDTGYASDEAMLKRTRVG